jgi:phenylacetate-CoA ligase
MMTSAENRVWDPAELLPRDRLVELQLERLRGSVARAGITPFYDAVLSRSGVAPGDIRTLDDLGRIPLTTKDDLRAHYPLGMLAVPRAEIARIHGS